MSLNKLLQQSLIWRGFYLITALILNVVLSRFLQAGGIGFVYYLANYFSLVLLVASISMESAFTYHASGNLISANKLASFGVLWTAVICVLLYFFFAVYFNWFEKNIAITQSKYIQYGLFFIAGMLLINFSSALFYAQRNFFLPNFLLGLMNIIAVIFLLIEKSNNAAASFFENSFFYITLIEGIVILLAFVFINKTFTRIEFPDKIELKLLFRYSAIAASANIVFFFVCRIDYWFVKYNCSASDLGNYIQASKLGQLLLIIPQVISSAMFSQTASGQLQEDVSEAIVRLFRILLQVFVAVTILVAITGKWLFPFVFGESFNKMQIPLLILLPGILCLAALSLLSAYFGGKGNIKLNLKGSVYGLIIVVIFNCIFIARYSIFIAACISSLGYAVSFVYSLSNFIKMDELKWREIIKIQKADWTWVIKMIIKK